MGERWIKAWVTHAAKQHSAIERSRLVCTTAWPDLKGLVGKSVSIGYKQQDSTYTALSKWQKCKDKEQITGCQGTGVGSVWGVPVRWCASDVLCIDGILIWVEVTWIYAWDKNAQNCTQGQTQMRGWKRTEFLESMQRGLDSLASVC